MGEKEKKDKNADETLEIIKEILNYKKSAQKRFQSASKVNKKKTELKLKKSIPERVKSRRKRLNIINKNKRKHKQ